jgi:hypothetical protein
MPYRALGVCWVTMVTVLDRITETNETNRQTSFTNYVRTIQRLLTADRNTAERHVQDMLGMGSSHCGVATW